MQKSRDTALLTLRWHSQGFSVAILSEVTHKMEAVTDPYLCSRQSREVVGHRGLCQTGWRSPTPVTVSRFCHLQTTHSEP